MAYMAVVAPLMLLLRCTSAISLVSSLLDDAQFELEPARRGRAGELQGAPTWRQLGNFTLPAALQVKDLLPALDGCSGFDCVLRYCAFDDGAFSWGVKGTRQGITRGVGWTSYELNLSSQAWMPKSTGTAWYHSLSIVVPQGLSAGTRQTGWATLVIGGAGHGSEEAKELAARTGAVAVVLGDVPNEGLSFRKEERYDLGEGTLQAWSWTQYARHANHPEWPVEMPNVKAVVRAMDAVAEFTRQAGALAAVPPVERFVVSGESKRGLATYIAGAVDPRVSAIIPLVMPLDFNTSEREAVQNLGGVMPAKLDYLREGVYDIPDEANERLWAIIDPLTYVDRLTMPKLAMFVGNDAFFPPDVSRSWWPLLPEPKAFHCYGNAPHGGYSSSNDFVEEADAFINAQILGTELPRVSWAISNVTGAISVRQLSGPSPTSVSLWSARSDGNVLRDFRSSLWSPQVGLQALPAGGWLAELAPEAGHWTAFYVAFEFAAASLGGRPWSLSTEVSVVPLTRPFPDANQHDLQYQKLIMSEVDDGVDLEKP